MDHWVSRPVEERSAPGHDGVVLKFTGPNGGRYWETRCSCGWEGEGRGRESGEGRENAIGELERHLVVS